PFRTTASPLTVVPPSGEWRPPPDEICSEIPRRLEALPCTEEAGELGGGSAGCRRHSLCYSETRCPPPASQGGRFAACLAWASPCGGRRLRSWPSPDS